MEQQDLYNLTELIDNYNYLNEKTITTTGLHTKLWAGLNQLRNVSNKVSMLEGWKYKSDFYSTENCHENGTQLFNRITWEESFVLSFWMGIYH